jgi:hypothetical protein
VKLEPDLSDFSRRLASAVSEVFSGRITAEPSAERELRLRGSNLRGQSVCTQVAVKVDPEVLAALEFATPLIRDRMMRNLADRLAARVQAQYDRNQPRESPLCLEVTAEMLNRS